MQEMKRTACKLESHTLPGMKISSDLRQADIRRIVRDRLQGFEFRQRDREAIRERKRRPVVEPENRQIGMFEMAESREDGYYWVKLDGQWMIGHFFNRLEPRVPLIGVLVCGFLEWFREDHFEKIHPQRIEEPKE